MKKNTQVSIGPLDVIEIYPADINNVIESPNVSSIQKNSTLDNLLKENLKNLRLEHLNKEEYNSIRKLCYEYRDIFHCSKISLSFTNIVKHEIRPTECLKPNKEKKRIK
ncbi:hypothetical protein HHI36_019697 [Cryptolaemus montrouzieri]|uniref:Uncharacterized protein n=1 Tax=Cryptolaemus montrouzieri TaxID=559131 RepID=A0ABD2N9M3_9CUCU